MQYHHFGASVFGSSIFTSDAPCSCSTTICKLVDIIPTLHNEIDRVLISSVLKPHAVLMLLRRSNMFKAFIHVVRVALRQLLMTSLTKQFTDPQIVSIMKLEKPGTEV